MLKALELQNLSNDSSLKGPGKVQKHKNLSDKIMDKIIEKSFKKFKKFATRKIQFLFFSNFLLVLTKFSFWEEDWALRFHIVFRFFWYFLISCDRVSTAFFSTKFQVISRAKSSNFRTEHNFATECNEKNKQGVIDLWYPQKITNFVTFPPTPKR